MCLASTHPTFHVALTLPPLMIWQEASVAPVTLTNMLRTLLHRHCKKNGTFLCFVGVTTFLALICRLLLLNQPLWLRRCRLWILSVAFEDTCSLQILSTGANLCCHHYIFFQMIEGKSRTSTHLVLMVFSPPPFREMRETLFDDFCAIVETVEQVALPKRCRRRICRDELAVEEQMGLVIVLLNRISRQQLLMSGTTESLDAPNTFSSSVRALL